MEELRRRLRPWRRALWWQDELDLIREAKELRGYLPEPLGRRERQLEERIWSYLTRFEFDGRTRVPQTAEEALDGAVVVRRRGRQPLPTPHRDALPRYASPREKWRADTQDRTWQLREVEMSEERRREVERHLARLVMKDPPKRVMADSTRRRMSEAQRARRRLQEIEHEARAQWVALKRKLLGQIPLKRREQFLASFQSADRIGAGRYRVTWEQTAAFVGERLEVKPLPQRRVAPWP